MFEFNCNEVFELWYEWDMRLWNERECKDIEAFFIECQASDNHDWCDVMW